MNTSGKKTAAREIVIARIVKLILSRDFSVAPGRPSLFHQPRRVLEEQDGIVDEEPDRQRQCHQR